MEGSKGMGNIKSGMGEFRVEGGEGMGEIKSGRW